MSSLETKDVGTVQAVPTDQEIAEELAEVLMRPALALGPLGRIRELSRLCRILRLVLKACTSKRDLEAYSLAALYPQRKVAKLAGVTPSTMQRWCEAGTAGAAHGRLWSASQPPQDLGSDTRTAGQDGVNGSITHS